MQVALFWEAFKDASSESSAWRSTRAVTHAACTAASAHGMSGFALPLVLKLKKGPGELTLERASLENFTTAKA